MGFGNQQNPLAIVVVGSGLIMTALGVLAVLPMLPGVVSAYFAHLQYPTADSFLTAVGYIVGAFIAFAIPTTLVGAALTVIANANV